MIFSWLPSDWLATLGYYASEGFLSLLLWWWWLYCFVLFTYWQSDAIWQVCFSEYRVAAHHTDCHTDLILPSCLTAPYSPITPSHSFSSVPILDAKDYSLFNWPSSESVKIEGDPDRKLSKCKSGMWMYLCAIRHWTNEHGWVFQICGLPGEQRTKLWLFLAWEKCLKNKGWEAEGVAWRLGVLTVLAEDLRLFPGTHWAAHKCLSSRTPRAPTLTCAQTYTHADKYTQTQKERQKDRQI